MCFFNNKEAGTEMRKKMGSRDLSLPFFLVKTNIDILHVRGKLKQRVCMCSVVNFTKNLRAALSYKKFQAKFLCTYILGLYFLAQECLRKSCS